jgi:hypothetical protein
MRRSGHDLSALQEGIIATLAQNTVDQPHNKAKLEVIRTAIETDGRWSEAEEWRISTWFDNEIVRTEREGYALYTASVRCDGQHLSCEGPSLERVFVFLSLYQAIISQGFYAAGPPWAK